MLATAFVLTEIQPHVRVRLEPLCLQTRGSHPAARSQPLSPDKRISACCQVTATVSRQEDLSLLPGQSHSLQTRGSQPAARLESLCLQKEDLNLLPGQSHCLQTRGSQPAARLESLCLQTRGSQPAARSKPLSPDKRISACCQVKATVSPLKRISIFSSDTIEIFWYSQKPSCRGNIKHSKYHPYTELIRKPAEKYKSQRTNLVGWLWQII